MNRLGPGPIRAVLFDAVGTLIHPTPEAAEVYVAAGRRYGSRLTLGEVRARFPAAFKRHALGQESSIGDSKETAVAEERSRWKTSPRLERQRWRRIVAEVLDDVSDAETLFDELWHHFAQARHWRLYDDVPAAWGQLETAGYMLGIASNFDHRLESVCRDLPPLSQCEHVLHSADLGYAKPDPRFYAVAADRLGLSRPQILLVGDDPWLDYDAARSAGLAALWLRRDAGSRFFTGTSLAEPSLTGPPLAQPPPTEIPLTQPQQDPAGSRQIVRSLREVAELLSS